MLPIPVRCRAASSCWPSLATWAASSAGAVRAPGTVAAGSGRGWMKAMIAWAKKILADPDAYAILDTETTGLDYNSRIVEIAVTTAAGQ